MKHIYKHIGFFTDYKVINYLKDKSADEILKYLKENEESFVISQTQFEEFDICLEDTDSEYSKSSNGDYLIIDGAKGLTDVEVEDKEGSCFIDIYYFYKIVENGISFSRNDDLWYIPRRDNIKDITI